MKFRDIVHTANNEEVGVPATKRAAGKYIPTPPKGPTESRVKLLNYLEANPNKWVNMLGLTKVVGNSEPSLRQMIRRLIENGTIQRTDYRNGYSKYIILSPIAITRRGGRSRSKAGVEGETKLLIWVSQNPLKPISNINLAVIIGTDPQRVVKDLVKRELLIKHTGGARASSYNLTDKGRTLVTEKVAEGAELPKGDERNSEVVIRKFDTPTIPKEPIKIPADKKPVIELPAAWQPQPVVAETPEKVGKSLDEYVVEKMSDGYSYWEFIKLMLHDRRFSDENMGVAVRTLRHYEEYMEGSYKRKMPK